MPGRRNKKPSYGLVLLLLLCVGAALGLGVLVVTCSLVQPPVAEDVSGQDPSGKDYLDNVLIPPVDPEGGSSPGTAARPQARTDAKARLYLILDDAGYHQDLLNRFLEIPLDFAVAVLPGLPGTGEAADWVLAAGKELLLHLPMEAESGADPGPGAVRLAMSPEEIRRVVARDLAEVPGVRGVNNHMGSAATADTTVMNAVMDVLKSQGLYFVDSRTSVRTVAAQVARERGVPTTERHVFLDNERNRQAILEALEGAKERATRQGYAVMIGHVWCSELAEVLLEYYPQIIDEGFEFAPLSTLLGDMDAGTGN